jgi:hypothetical protein
MVIRPSGMKLKRLRKHSSNQSSSRLGIEDARCNGYAHDSGSVMKRQISSAEAEGHGKKRIPDGWPNFSTCGHLKFPHLKGRCK